MRFRIGDTVRISSHFTDLDDEATYPSNTNGKVVEIIGSAYPVKVMFDNIDYVELNERHSEFKEEELKLVRRN